MPTTQAKSKNKRLKRNAKQARAKATVEAIVEAAAQILARKGAPGLNTNAVARRAGVSVGSVYEYFSNKHEIVDFLLDRHLAEGEAALRDGAANLGVDPSPSDVIEALVDGAIRLHQNDPELHRVLSSEIALDQDQQKRVDNLRLGLIGAVSAALARSQEDPEIKATILVDTADALAHRWIVDEAGTPIPADRLASEMTKMLKAYLKTD